MLAWFKLFRKAPENLAELETARALASRWADVERARAHGYPLCNCTMPPTIMVVTASETHEGCRDWRCPSCGCRVPVFENSAPRNLVN